MLTGGEVADRKAGATSLQQMLDRDIRFWLWVLALNPSATQSTSRPHLECRIDGGRREPLARRGRELAAALQKRPAASFRVSRAPAPAVQPTIVRAPKRGLPCKPSTSLIMKGFGRRPLAGLQDEAGAAWRRGEAHGLATLSRAQNDSIAALALKVRSISSQP